MSLRNVCLLAMTSELQRLLSLLENRDPEAGGNCTCYPTAYCQHLRSQANGFGTWLQLVTWISRTETLVWANYSKSTSSLVFFPSERNWVHLMQLCSLSLSSQSHFLKWNICFTQQLSSLQSTIYLPPLWDVRVRWVRPEVLILFGILHTKPVFCTCIWPAVWELPVLQSQIDLKQRSYKNYFVMWNTLTILKHHLQSSLNLS